MTDEDELREFIRISSANVIVIEKRVKQSQKRLRELKGK